MIFSFYLPNWCARLAEGLARCCWLDAVNRRGTRTVRGCLRSGQLRRVA